MSTHTNLTTVVSRVLCAALVALILPQEAFAVNKDIRLTFRPHCIQVAGNDGDTDWIFGPIPSGGLIANTNTDGPTDIPCSSFEVQDPLTLRTTALREGDILDIDVIAENPSAQPVSHFRLWISYDPNILEGELAEINGAYPLMVPDENDFFPEEGYAKLQASTTEDAPTAGTIPLARLQFRVKKTTNVGSPIGFHDTQPDGHTFVNVQEGPEALYAIDSEPGILLVTFRQASGETESSASSSSSSTEVLADDNVAVSDNFNPFDSGSSASATSASSQQKAREGEACIQNQGCETGLCIAGICAAAGTVENGGACSVDEECASGLCGGGTCVSNLDNVGGAGDGTSPQRTAFALLQIQNLRVTTEGSAVFLAWDHLRSSALQNYNVYYGTTSGKYIQRKTLAKEDNTITIRSLPTGVQYYFAVRGVSVQGEESAFSREVSVIVGNPASATMPLVRGTEEVTGNPLTGNIIPAEELPGETGLPSFLVLAVIVSAVAGTSFAARRQMIVHPTTHE